MAIKSTREALKGYSEFVRQMMKHWKVPGCAIGIVKGGKVVMLQGFGQRDVKNKLPVTSKTLFAIGSCTKAFTTMAMGILVDEGKLAWDKPVRDYLPDFKLSDSTITERITPRDLVTHRSGLPRHDFLWYGSPFSRQDIVARLRHLEFNKDLRQDFQYNNLMYAVAGAIIERISKHSWEEFVQQRIFAPLGMKYSNLSVTVSQKRKDYALPYKRDLETEIVSEIPFRKIDNIGPAGSINSCATDMVKWLLLHLNKGRVDDKSLISEANLKLIHAPHVAVAGASEMDAEFGQSTYGLGWGIGAWRGHSFVQHGGGIDGFLTLTTLLPSDGIGVFVVNNLNGSPLNEVLSLNAIDRLLRLKPVPLAKRWRKREIEAQKSAKKGKSDEDTGRRLDTQPSHALPDYAGEYEHPGYGRLAIQCKDAQLRFTFHSMRMELRHYHYDVFEGEFKDWKAKFKINFLTDTDGFIHSLTIPLEPLVKPTVFTKLATKLDRKILIKCVGEYDAAGMGVNIALQGDDQLMLVFPNSTQFELVPIEGLRFKVKTLEGFTLEFKQAKDGRVVEAISQQPNATFAWPKK